MNWLRRLSAPEPRLVDVSREAFGKYQHCTQYDGVFYSDEDFDRGFGIGKPKLGSIPSPREDDRTPFGQNRRPVFETEAMKRGRWERERIETNALLEQLASELAPEVEAEQPEWLEKYKKEYEADVDGYKFDCRRHGNFLSLFMTRNGNPTSEGPLTLFGRIPNQDRELATTINLMQSREIRFTLGHAPDLGGAVQWPYYCAMLGDSTGTSGSIGGTQFGNYKARDGYQWKVQKPEPWVPHGRPLFGLDPPARKDDHNVYYAHDDSYKIKFHVACARAAKDDVIRFEWVGATVYAPAGLGSDVHAKILKALE
jgi:hypothetical protein